MRLILASQSPRRADLLTAAGYRFDVHAVDVDERQRPGERPTAYVERLAITKATQALRELTTGADFIVVGADTAVVVGDRILGKPRDAEDAARMLRLLSGRSHQVMTGLSACRRASNRTEHGTQLGAGSAARDFTVVETTTVWFVKLTEEQIAWYVASGEGTDKAGGYAIQGLASRFIPKIEGSYSNVVGLPVAALDTLIQRLSRTPGALASKG